MDDNTKTTETVTITDIDDNSEIGEDVKKNTEKKESGGVVLAILSLIGNFLLFNIVFVLLLLPVFTIGAALTAYFDIVFTAKYDKKHRDYSVKMLLQRFREHLKLSTYYFLGYLLVMGFLIALALVFSSVGPLPCKPVSIAFILLAGILFAILVYTFPVLALNAVTSDYRATVYALQDRDRAEAAAAEQERMKAEKEAAGRKTEAEDQKAEEETEDEKTGDAEAEDKRNGEAVAEVVGNKSDDSAIEAGDQKAEEEAGSEKKQDENTSVKTEKQEDQEHVTMALSNYMKRFSKVVRTPAVSREIMKKGSYNTDSSLNTAGKDSDTQAGNEAISASADQEGKKYPEDISGTDNTRSAADMKKSQYVTNTEVLYTYDSMPVHEDRNSITNVLLDSMYFAAKHFVALMFTLILYLLPGAIIYIFYEDTVLLIAGFAIFGIRLIMGINARIYYGSFYEYDDYELDDADSDAEKVEAGIAADAEDETADDSQGDSENEASDDTQSDSENETADDSQVDSENEASDETHVDSEDSAVVRSETESVDTSDEEDRSADDSEEPEISQNAADRIKNLLNVHADDEDDPDVDEDEENVFDDPEEPEAEDADGDHKKTQNEAADGDPDQSIDDDDIEITY